MEGWTWSIYMSSRVGTSVCDNGIVMFLEMRV